MHAPSHSLRRPWAKDGLAPGGYFAQWMDGVWLVQRTRLLLHVNENEINSVICVGHRPSLMLLPSAFDGGIDEVALYEQVRSDMERCYRVRCHIFA